MELLKLQNLDHNVVGHGMAWRCMVGRGNVRDHIQSDVLSGKAWYCSVWLGEVRDHIQSGAESGGVKLGEAMFGEVGQGI